MFTLAFNTGIPDRLARYLAILTGLVTGAKGQMEADDPKHRKTEENASDTNAKNEPTAQKIAGMKARIIGTLEATRVQMRHIDGRASHRMTRRFLGRRRLVLQPRSIRAAQA